MQITLGMWVTFAVWIIVFAIMAYNGWHVDEVIPSYLFIVAIIAAAGYTFGLGARLTKALFNLLF